MAVDFKFSGPNLFSGLLLRFGSVSSTDLLCISSSDLLQVADRAMASCDGRCGAILEVGLWAPYVSASSLLVADRRRCWPSVEGEEGVVDGLEERCRDGEGLVLVGRRKRPWV